VTSHAKPSNGNETKVAANAKKAVASSAEDIQDDLQSLRDDVTRLSQQLAKFATAKGNEALGIAKDNFDDMFNDAQARGHEAMASVSEVRDNLAKAIEESLERRPYTTLALALTMGFVAGAVWKR